MPRPDAIHCAGPAVYPMTRPSEVQVASDTQASDGDAALVLRLAAGDLDAASQLYDRHAARMSLVIADG